MAKVPHLFHHHLVPGSYLQAFGHRTDGVHVKSLHFVHGHILRPKVYFHGARLGPVPQGNVNGFGKINLVTGVRRPPADRLRHMLIIEGNAKMYFRFFHLEEKLLAVGY
jgi:hypothetical protein